MRLPSACMSRNSVNTAPKVVSWRMTIADRTRMSSWVCSTFFERASHLRADPFE